MSRFFVDKNTISNNRVYLSAEDSQHAIKVLRLAENDIVTVCDGASFEYDARIIKADKSGVKVELFNQRKADTEPAVRVTLIQCLPKAGKMEVIIQKCVELGVHDIIPVESERSVVKISGSTQNKIERYNRIAYEAAKQSGRGIIPKVRNFTKLNDIDYSEFDFLLVPYEEEHELTLKHYIESSNLLKSASNVAIVIGPEGGIDQKEIEFLRSKGGITLTLGKRILRTETAGMATLAMLFCLLEG